MIGFELAASAYPILGAKAGDDRADRLLPPVELRVPRHRREQRGRPCVRRRRPRALAVVKVHASALFLDGQALAPLLAGERQVEGVRRLLHLLQHRQRGRHVGERRVERGRDHRQHRIPIFDELGVAAAADRHLHRISCRLDFLLRCSSGRRARHRRRRRRRGRRRAGAAGRRRWRRRRPCTRAQEALPRPSQQAKGGVGGRGGWRRDLWECQAA